MSHFISNRQLVLISFSAVNKANCVIFCTEFVVCLYHAHLKFTESKYGSVSNFTYSHLPTTDHLAQAVRLRVVYCDRFDILTQIWDRNQ